MKKIFLSFLFGTTLISFGQTFPRTEIVLGISTHDNSIPFGNGHFTDSLEAAKSLGVAGIYSNKSGGFHFNIKFYRSANAAFRIKGLFLTKNITTSSNSYSPLLNADALLKQQVVRIAPGFQWGIQQGPVEFFGGIELPLSYIANSRYESLYEYETYSVNTTASVPGGFSVGTGLFFGSTFHVNKFLVLGCEFNGSYGYTKVGGAVSNVYKITSGGATTESYYVYDEIIKQIGFSSLQANFYVGINF